MKRFHLFVPATNELGWPRRPLWQRIWYPLNGVRVSSHVMPPCPFDEEQP